MSDVDGVDSIGVGKISRTIDVSPNEKKSRSVIDVINDAAVPHTGRCSFRLSLTVV
jgi:hypothetical protein